MHSAVLLRARIKPGRNDFVTGDLASKPESYPDGADIRAAHVMNGSPYFQTQAYALYRGERSTTAKKPKAKTTGVCFPVSIWDLAISTPDARSYAVPSNAVHADNFEFEVMGHVNAKE